MNLKKLLRTPYPYIFLLTYYGIWLLWTYIKLPFTNPVDAISYIPSIHYNPSNNILRFLIAVLAPPLACLGYWWLDKHGAAFWKRHGNPGWRKVFSITLVVLSVVLALSAGLVQGSTKKSASQTGAYGGPYTHPLVDTFHEGETLGPAVSYQRPDLKPYKDFVIVHGVFQDPVSGVLAFKLFGRSIGATRTIATILTMFTFVLLYVLFLVLFKGDLVKSAIGVIGFAVLALASTILFPFKDFIIGLILPVRDSATMAFLICAMLGFRYHLAKRMRLTQAMSAAIGFIAIACFANSIDRAIYIAMLALIWLIMIAFTEKWRVFFRQIFSWFAVGCLAGLFVLGLALKWEFGGFINYLVTMSLYKEFLDGMVFQQPGAALNVLLITISLILGLILFWFANLLDKSSARNKSLKAKVRALAPPVRKAIIDHHVLILLGFTALLFIRSALGRALLDHFNYSVQWMYVALIYFLLQYGVRKSRLAMTYLTLIALAFLLVFYVGIVKKTDLRAEAFPTRVPDEKVVRKDYLETAAYLKRNLKGDETFATLTSEGIWYYLVDKPSPVNYPIIWYAFTKQQRTQLAEDIEHNPDIKYLITNSNWTSNFDYVSNEQRFPELYKVLHRDYQPVKGFGEQTVWQRNRP